MRFFVTGGTGFVGRRLVQELVAQYGSENVVCLVSPRKNSLEQTGLELLQTLNVAIIYADSRSWQPAPHEIPPFEVLFHLAATIDTASLEHTSNDQGTEHLLRVLGDQLRGTRVMYVSTTAVIDRNGPANYALDETSPCQPKTEYGRSKLRAENIIRTRQETLGYTYTILRPGIIYGAGPTRSGGLFNLFAKWIQTGHLLARIPWPGKTGVIFVEDVARILTTFAQESAAANETFCLVTESPTISEIASSMARALQVPYQPVKLPGWSWKFLRNCLGIPGLFSILPWFLAVYAWRLSHMVDHGLWCDGSKMRQLYHEPLVMLDEGLKLMLRKKSS